MPEPVQASPPQPLLQSAGTAGHPVQACWRIIVSGRVQGVGFRPFVYRLATRCGLRGTVRNTVGEVEIVVAGDRAVLGDFQQALIDEAPPLARPRIERCEETALIVPDGFRIAASSAGTAARIAVPADCFMCDDCRDELRDPADRRYRYPFINCTQCGPRYTLIRSLPYDRANTAMAAFELCADCRLEYEEPLDRRFHAEPVACPACGPQLYLRVPGLFQHPAGAAERDLALAGALELLRAGRIVAVRGIGGYHLMCDARNEVAVATLRRRKARPHKPLAVMFPSAGGDGLARVRDHVLPSAREAELIAGPARPIVLVRRRPDSDLAVNVAPGLAELGVFLPYSPLHQLLLDAFDGPLIATSGNLSGEPVLTDAAEADARLDKVADAFLHHDRPILRPADDPVYRQIGSALRPLRIGRGNAPRECALPWQQAVPVLAVGGHMKATIALSWERRCVVSPHIGDMDSPRSLAVFETLVRDLQRLYGVRAQAIACDAHPAYTTGRWARAQRDLPVISVWHHHAHASALAAEHGGGANWLVFTWDGVGLGEDASLWGGEALYGGAGRWQRLASMRPFRLPGGERAGREPWRSAAALAWECGLAAARLPDPDGLARAAWERRLNCPETSAVGRLFDAAAHLVLGIERTSFEAQGPMLLEALCRGPGRTIGLPMAKDAQGVLRSDWQPLLAELANARLAPAARAETLHTSMAGALLDQARRLRASRRIDRVGLSGGVFQNRVLCEQAQRLLEDDGFRVALSGELPCNDAALSFGQAAEVAARASGP